MINDISANMFLSLIFEKYCSQNKQRKRSRMFNIPLIVQQFLFITCIVQRKKRKKENFTYAKRNPQNEVISKLKSLMINDPQKFINSFFLSFSHEFWTFKTFLNLGTLSSLHINDLQEGSAHLPEILNRMKLKYIECAHMKWSHNLEQW